MVDSNLQREHILPSERAKAYKMKLDALKKQGERTDLTSRPLVGKFETADVIGGETCHDFKTASICRKKNQLNRIGSERDR